MVLGPNSGLGRGCVNCLDSCVLLLCIWDDSVGGCASIVFFSRRFSVDAVRRLGVMDINWIYMDANGAMARVAAEWSMLRGDGGDRWCAYKRRHSVHHAGSNQQLPI